MIFINCSHWQCSVSTIIYWFCFCTACGNRNWIQRNTGRDRDLQSELLNSKLLNGYLEVDLSTEFQNYFLKVWKLWTGFSNCILCLKPQICSIFWLLKCSNFSIIHSKNHNLKSKQHCTVDKKKMLFTTPTPNVCTIDSVYVLEMYEFLTSRFPMQRDGSA